VSGRVGAATALAAAALLGVACGDQPAPPPAGQKSGATAPTPAETSPAPAARPSLEPAPAAPTAKASPRMGSAEKGKQVWLGQCVACHNPDPARDGTLGPAVKGASPALLEARVVRGEYPPGYQPKRPTKVMPPRPDLASSVPDLAAYLQ
jgi:mono/diheme cytochrome c family protein